MVGVAVLFYLRDGIRDAPWLSEPEKVMLQGHLDAEPERKRPRVPLARLLRQPRLLGLSFIYFCVSMGLYGAVSFWLPQLVKNSGFQNPLHIGLLTAVPYFCSIPAMLLLSRSSPLRSELRLSNNIAGMEQK